MGFYNPDAPTLLGEQWVPIRDIDLAFNESVNSVERGFSFTIPVATQLSQARFYIHEPPQRAMDNQTYTIGIYPKGQENQSGPIRSVIIPCNVVGATGAASFANAGSGPAAVANPSADFNQGIGIQTGNGAAVDLSFWFNVDAYAPLLYNKRLLDVQILTAGRFSPPGTPTFGELRLSIANDSKLIEYFMAPNPFANDFTPAGNYNRTDSMGDVAPFFNNTRGQVDLIPWNFAELQKFQASAGVNRTNVHLRSDASGGFGIFVYVTYVALKVWYVEETRVAFGSRMYDDSSSLFVAGNGTRAGMPVETNRVLMRDIAGTVNPNLAVGEYTVTVSQASRGTELESVSNVGPQALLNANRQYYPIAGLVGVELDIPTPLNDAAIGQTFTAEDSDILPQISLHVSGGTPYPQMHVYGRQAAGQVYGNNFVTQEILDSAAGAAFSYPWVRYYARRFGDTTVPLKLDTTSPPMSGFANQVYLSPSEWDELPEIVDGWKQVDRRFGTAPSMGTGFTPTWRWSAVGELKGNRWEVLGCIAPALSGLPGNSLNLAVPATSQLGSATYGQPAAGTTVNMSWIPQYGPYVSGATDDQTSDAVLIFSQDPATITGFTLTPASQAVSGIGQKCFADPCGIPTAINYHQLTWTTPVDAGFDYFTRTVAAGSWGNSTSGVTWVLTGPAVDYSVNGTTGLMAHPIVNNARKARYGGQNMLDVRQQVDLSCPVQATGVAIQSGLVFRSSLPTDQYEASLIFQTDNTVAIRLISRVGGTPTTLNEVTIGYYAPSTVFTLQAQIQGNRFCAKAWKVGEEEPEYWQANAVTTVFTAAGTTGLRSEVPTSNTNTLPVVMTFDNYTVLPSTPGYLEIQRSDTVDTDWQTIMLGSPTVSGFKDFESRVGIATSYRIRYINNYGFYGAWSSTVSATMTSPGVSGSCLSGEAHVLLFSTNSLQDGRANLAYSSIWDDHVQEDFAFPEAGFNQLQTMYNKNFFTAFRPLERGGDVFTREVLVQAAAIAPETLSDFTSLRDMAWDSVPYICVRDEDGNRWFANVSVPAGRVLLNRTLYRAQLNIVEVSDTPFAVSP
jgi:hypothetical protein